MKLLIHTTPNKEATDNVVFYLSGGFVKESKVHNYYLKDQVDNTAFIKTYIKGVTDDYSESFPTNFYKVWGRPRTLVALYEGWYTMLSRLTEKFQEGTALTIELIWANAHFPQVTFEYLFNLTKPRHLNMVDPRHKKDIKLLSDHFSSITVGITKIGKPITVFHINNS